MLKRFGISFCILLAFTLLQAHNFVVHHHGEPNETRHGHSHDGTAHHHHHDKPVDKDGGSDEKEADGSDQKHSPFNDASHTSELGKVLVRDEGNKVSFDSKLVTGFLSAPAYLQTAIHNPLFRARPPDKGCRLHLIFISHSLPARAPPACT